MKSDLPDLPEFDARLTQASRDRFQAHLQTLQSGCPGLEILTARPHNLEGQFSDVIIVNESLIFRFPRYPQGMRMMQAELRVLAAIAGRLPMPVPAPRYTNPQADNPEQMFMGYPMLSGVPLWRDDLLKVPSQHILDQWARQLAAFLHDLHHLDTAGLDLPQQDTPQDWSHLYEEIRTYLFPFMRPIARQEVAEHFENYLEHLDQFNFTHALRHGDFGFGNLLYDPQSWALSGVIDFGFAGIGDPALDLAAITCLGPQVFQGICQHYPASPAMLHRARFYKGTYALQEALHGLLNRDQAAFQAGMQNYI